MRWLTVALCVLALTTGCLGIGAINGNQQSSRATTATSEGGSGCAVLNVPLSEGNESGSYPDLPATLTAQTAKDYARAFERAFAYNRVYESSYDRIHVNVGHGSTNQVDGGIVVTIETVEVSTVDDGVVGDDAWTTVYVINDSGVQRKEGRAGKPPGEQSGDGGTTVCR